MTADSRQADVTISPELADKIDRALTKAVTNAIAHYSDEPYADDPRWSPWTRFGKPLASRCDEARKALRACRPTSDEGPANG